MKLEVDKNLDDQINSFISQYQSEPIPILVNFRKLLPNLSKKDKDIHTLHSYPAKLLVHIPHFLLNNNVFSKEHDLVLDPFCGSGTVLLESILAGRNAIGADSNPLARLITKVKTTAYDYNKLLETLSRIKKTFSEIETFDIPDVLNKDYWFLVSTQKELGKLLHIINSIEQVDIKEFFLICLSGCIRKFSLTDPRIPVPVKLNLAKFEIDSLSWLNTKKILDYIDNNEVIQLFIEIAESSILKHSCSTLKNSKNKASIIAKDARKLTTCVCSNEILPDNSVDYIVTSPPYAGAQKYIRSSFLNIGWLKLSGSKDIKKLDALSIGREEHPKALSCKLVKTNISLADSMLEKVFENNPTRAYIAGQYLVEMQEALDESYRVLKPNGYMVLIVGNNQVCGSEFNTQEYLSEYMTKKGMKVIFKLIDNIKFHGLMTKRNKTANIITREWVLVFKKIAE